MKQYCFDIGAWQADEMFSPIRGKKAVIELLMKTLKVISANQEIPSEQSGGQIVLVVSKMSRLFFFAEDKYVSINFPFTVRDTEEGLIFSSRHIADIDSKITSDVLSVLKDTDSFDSSCILEFADPIASITDYNSEFWAFFRGLLLYEDGYIRYDYDEEHANGLLHPLNHYDVFYSSGATFKIGLKARIGREVIIDLLRTDSSCHFVE